ncbi:MAG: hypothetical protein PHC84_01080 [Clostridia bacterium]|nr:hypothetical protein [Clostridia bacterium]
MGGKVSGEALTILSYAAAKHLKNGFDDADIKYPIIRINGEAEKAAAVIEKTIGNPFFDINEPKKSGDEPFDISAWAENLGRHIELIFDGEAVAELTESMARLSGVPVDNPKGVELWIRACGRAVKDTAAELPADWVRKNHDESYVGLPSRCLDLKMRNSIAGILVGAKLLAKTLSDYRDLTFYDAFGVLPDDFEDWLIKTQRTDR